MKNLTVKLMFVIMTFAFASCTSNNQINNSNDMIIRLTEIQIVPEYLDAYLAILKEESETSLKVEPGVISIFPMSQKENPTEIRILEIYASQKAYESHLQTKHFKHYKTTTLEMVKSLKLVDMNGLDRDYMPLIFKKMN